MRTTLHKALIALAGIVLASAASAQTTATKVSKIAILSLIGDVMNVAQARTATGTTIQSNYNNALKMPSSAFDAVALGKADEEITRQLPGSAVAMLAVPAAGSVSDPARLLVDDRVVTDNPVMAALKANGFSHLLVIRKLRSTAQLRMYEGAVGSGMLEGIGFYLDYDLRTQSVETQRSGQGFIAPYVYIELDLIDVQAAQVVGRKAIKSSTTVGAYHNKAGDEPWGAMTSEQKVTTLQAMIRKSIAENLPPMLGAQ